MEKKELKIVTIGGGSSYTPELIDGLISRKDELFIQEIVLVDIKEGREKLEVIGGMAKRMIKAAGLKWKITITLDRFAALKNADYVITQFRVGLLEARIRDERIPLSHGILGQETNGAGGIFKAFRTIPVILDVIKDMKLQCPNAWLINFANPAGMVTDAAINYGKWERTIGLCNIPITHLKTETKKMNIDENELWFQYAGINHFHWHRVFDKNGNERTNDIIDEMYGTIRENKNEGKSEDFYENENYSKDAGSFLEGAFHYEQVKDLGMLPCGYHRYYYLEDVMLQEAIKDFEEGNTRAQAVKRIEQDLFEQYKNPTVDYKPKELSRRGGTYYSDAACNVISAIENNTHTEMVVSTKNNGTITDLPDSSIVEVSGVVTGKGFIPYNWGSFENAAARGYLQMMKAMEETTIRAAVLGSYNSALQAFTMNPLIPSGHIAKTLLDRMLYAHRDHLPQFSEEINDIEKNQEKDVEYVNKLMKSN